MVNWYTVQHQTEILVTEGYGKYFLPLKSGLMMWPHVLQVLQNIHNEALCNDV